MHTDKPMQALEKAKKIAECLDNKKGRRITVLEVGELTSISDYFVIASGGSAAQVKAMADAKRVGKKQYPKQGVCTMD